MKIRCVEEPGIQSTHIVTSAASPNGMLGMLLITCENGSPLKTYGLNRLNIGNMKIAFLWSVIALSCSVCASETVEIYPGLKLDEEQGQRLVNSAFLERLRQHLLPQHSYQYSTQEELQKVERFLHNFRLPKNEDAAPYFYPSRTNYDDVDEDEYRYLERARNVQPYNARYPNNQMLDDVRPYPHDFTYGEEEEEDEGPEERTEVDKEVLRTTQMLGHHHAPVRQNQDKGEEASGKGELEEVPVVEDLSEFGYLPSDPRFFQNTESTDGVPNVQAKLPESNYGDDLHLIHRSDEAFSGELTHSDYSADSKTDNQVEVVALKPQMQNSESAGVYIIAVVAGISAAATVGLIAVGIGWYNLQKHVKNASDVEYPAYGVTGPNKDASPSGDRRLAQSAQMYHYQHQKQQIIAMESRAATGERHGSVSEADSDEENEEGDYTVYECPGLAPTGEMEVKNPLFQNDPTPAQTPPVKPNGEEKK